MNAIGRRLLANKLVIILPRYDMATHSAVAAVFSDLNLGWAASPGRLGFPKMSRCCRVLSLRDREPSMNLSMIRVSDLERSA
jgi:hypothetical protein